MLTSTLTGIYTLAIDSDEATTTTLSEQTPVTASPGFASARLRVALSFKVIAGDVEISLGGGDGWAALDERYALGANVGDIMLRTGNNGTGATVQVTEERAA